MSDEDDEDLDFPFFYTRIGELEFQVEGKSGDSTEEVGKMFREELKEVVKHGKKLQEKSNGGSFQ